jgi:multidrug efflux pump subunit AcrA (membrane-fusion protein)
MPIQKTVKAYKRGNVPQLNVEPTLTGYAARELLKVEQTIEQTIADVDVLIEGNNTNETAITNLQADITALEADITALEADITVIEADVAALEALAASEAYFTLTVLSGQTSGTANHGLSGTPARVFAMPRANFWLNVFWVSAITATQVTVSFSGAVPQNIPFDVFARL